jgi:hypothetical protein
MTSVWLALAFAWGLQGPVDFSGQWAADPPAAKAAGDMGSGWGTPLTITQDGKALVVQAAIFSRYDIQPPVKMSYSLDGSESRNDVMTGHASQARVSRAKWDGGSLEITTSYPAVDAQTGKSLSTNVVHRLTLESPGVLVIEVARAGALGGKATTTRSVYRKQ